MILKCCGKAFNTLWPVFYLLNVLCDGWKVPARIEKKCRYKENSLGLTAQASEAIIVLFKIAA